MRGDRGLGGWVDEFRITNEEDEQGIGVELKDRRKDVS